MIKSKRGGGPKTPEGKLAASANAIKTGAYSRHVVLPGESEQDFQELLAQFNRDFLPSDVAEAAIVRELAVLTWKRLRLERLEYSALLDAMNEPIADYQLSARKIPVIDGVEWLIRDLSVVTPELVNDSQQMLVALKRLAGSKSLATDFASLCAEYPMVLQAFVDLASDYYVFQNIELVTPQLLLEQDLIYEERRRNFVEVAIIKLQAKAEQVLFVNSRLDKLKSAVTSIKEARMLVQIRKEGAQRVSDDLGRAFFRTLAELRRQQKWRQEIGTIDVTELE